jgi:hypothetical protein
MNCPDPIEELFRAYEEGRAGLLVTGRSLYDFVVDDAGKMRPLLESFRRAAVERYGMATLTFSLAAGLEWSEALIADERDRRLVHNTLQANHLTDISRDGNETVSVIRGIASLNRATAEGKWSDGRPLRFATLFEFSEHIAPSLSNGLHSEAQVVAIELAYVVGQSLSLRNSGNVLLFHGREGLVDNLIAAALYPVRLHLPDAQEKLNFLEAAQLVYPQSRFDSGLNLSEVASVLTNTPNRRVEALMRSSHRARRPITLSELTQQKSRDVEEISEGTLTSLDARRVEKLKLVGCNVEKPAEVLSRCAEGLRRGDTCIPANILLAGAPSTGKTDLALLTAWRARTSAYQWHSPKAGVVGETERKARIQQTVSREWVPNVCFVDEITESLPMERSDFDGDSGASRAVMAAMLTALSDETRRGKSLLIATTNCSWRMSAAMRSRFVVLPVLMPLAQDYPEILAAIAQQTDPRSAVSPEEPAVRDAAGIFSAKNANPRQMRAAMTNILLLTGKLSGDSLIAAARDFTGSQDYSSAVFSDLWALKACTSRSFLPWDAKPSAYPFPVYLQGVVGDDGEIQQQELDRRIDEYRKFANV